MWPRSARQVSEIARPIPSNYVRALNGLTATLLLPGDFEYAWKRVSILKQGLTTRRLFFNVEGATEAYNEGKGRRPSWGQSGWRHCREVKLVNDFAYFLSLTSFYAFAPVNKKVVEANADWADDLSDKSMSLTGLQVGWVEPQRGPGLREEWQYWDKDNVKVDRVNAQIVSLMQQLLRCFNLVSWLRQRTIRDLVYGILWRLRARILKVTPESAIYVYKFNTKDSVLYNVQYPWKALATAGPYRQGLVTSITKAEQKPAKGLCQPQLLAQKQTRYFKDALWRRQEYLIKGFKI